MKDHYSKKIFIPHVDGKDNFISPIERWEAHEKGILHRAFTVAVFYNGLVICQHRRHPAFDGWFDLTASSHPEVIEGQIQSNEDAAIKTLQREWNINEKEITDLKDVGAVMYKTPDPNSKYIEHEFCHFLTAGISRLPVPNAEFAYGYTLQSLESLKSQKNPLNGSLASWVKEAFKKGVL